MKKLILFFLLSFSIVFAIEPIKFYFDHAKFPADENNMFVEFYYKIPKEYRKYHMNLINCGLILLRYFMKNRKKHNINLF